MFLSVNGVAPFVAAPTAESAVVPVAATSKAARHEDSNTTCEGGGRELRSWLTMINVRDVCQCWRS